MLLDYLENKSITNTLTKELDEAVEEARRNEKWRLEYMKERVIYMEAREDGRLDGLEEGRAQTLVKSVDAAMKNFHMDLSGACKGLGYTLEEYEKAKELIDSKEE